MQEALEAQRKAQEEAERLAEEQRLKVRLAAEGCCWPQWASEGSFWLWLGCGGTGHRPQLAVEGCHWLCLGCGGLSLVVVGLWRAVTGWAWVDCA